MIGGLTFRQIPYKNPLNKLAHCLDHYNMRSLRMIPFELAIMYQNNVYLKYFKTHNLLSMIGLLKTLVMIVWYHYSLP